MLSNLKLRTLFIAALVLPSMLVLFIAVANQRIVQTASDDFRHLGVQAVKQANRLQLAQVFAVQMMNRSYVAALGRGMLEHKAEIQAAREFGRRAQESFDGFAKQAADSPSGQEILAKIQPPFARLMKSLNSVVDLVEQGDEGDRATRLRINEVTPAYTEYSHIKDDFGRQTDALIATVNARQAKILHTANVLLPIFIVLLLIISGGAVWVLIRHVLKPLDRANRLFDDIASGDLTRRVHSKAQNEIGQLFRSLQRMQDGLKKTVVQVRQGAHEINASVGEIAVGNTELSGRTESEAVSLEEAAASMRALALTVKQNADNARQARELAASTSDVAGRAGVAVSEVVDTMGNISTQSNKIAEIVSVIDTIAFQTNILALNAAVEAARAGAQGKGFAVVAGEVRALAQKSAQAAKEIKTWIDDSVKRVENGTQQVELAGRTMRDIVESVQHVTAIMGEIAVASQEQTSGIDQVNQAVTKMDEATQQNAALVEQAAAAALSLKEQTDRLVQAVATFKIQDEVVCLDVPAGLKHDDPRTPYLQLSAAY